MKKFINPLVLSVSILAIFVGLMTLLGPDTALAANTNEVKNGVNSVGGSDPGNGSAAFTNLLQSIINILLFLIGAIAVIMIIIGGLRYVISGGDQGAITGAKNTILYAVIGLVVAIMAYAIINWVIGAL